MTNVFKYFPRAAELPESLKEKAEADGIDLVQIDEMLEIWADVKGAPTEEVSKKYQDVLVWYLRAHRDYEAETDPQGIRAEERAELVRADIDALCPSIPTLHANELDATLEDRSKRFTIVLLYSAPGCAWCVPMAETLEAMVPEMENFRFFKVCYNLDPEVFKRFCILSFPTMLLFETVKLRSLLTGVRSPEEIRAWCAPTVETHRANLEWSRAQEEAREREQAAKAEQPVCVDGVCEVPASN